MFTRTIQATSTNDAMQDLAEKAANMEVCF